jgi:excisionase family DNA binding protein
LTTGERRRSMALPKTSSMEPLAVSVEEAERISGIGRTKLYELLSSGAIKSRKVGRRRLVIVWSLRAYLEADDGEAERTR